MWVDYEQMKFGDPLFKGMLEGVSCSRVFIPIISPSYLVCRKTPFSPRDTRFISIPINLRKAIIANGNTVRLPFVKNSSCPCCLKLSLMNNKTRMIFSWSLLGKFNDAEQREFN